MFDAFLLGVSAVLHPARLRAISDIEGAVASWPDMRTGVHRLGGLGFRSNGKETSHIHGNGLLDCFVGRANREELVREGRALPHHIFSQSGWISFWVEGADDVCPALELIRTAARRQSRE